MTSRHSLACVLLLRQVSNLHQRRLLYPRIHPHFSTGAAGIPIKLLFEAEGMKVTAEMKNGEIYRGLLLNAEDTMNMTLSDVVRTARNGQVMKLPSVYLRGSAVRFIALPELLKNAPVFKKVATLKKKAEAERQNASRSGGSKRKRE